MRKRRVTTTASRRVFTTFERGVFVPVQKWLREMELPPGLYDELPEDLFRSLEETHELLRQVVQAAEQAE